MRAGTPASGRLFPPGGGPRLPCRGHSLPTAGRPRVRPPGLLAGPRRPGGTPPTVAAGTARPSPWAFTSPASGRVVVLVAYQTWQMRASAVCSYSFWGLGLGSHAGWLWLRVPGGCTQDVRPWARLCPEDGWVGMTFRSHPWHLARALLLPCLVASRGAAHNMALASLRARDLRRGGTTRTEATASYDLISGPPAAHLCYWPHRPTAVDVGGADGGFGLQEVRDIRGRLLSLGAPPSVLTRHLRA